MSKSILVFGAGSIGLSFIGQIFQRSGYQVVFVDANRDLVKQINRYHRYKVVLLHPEGNRDSIDIPHITAFHVDENKSILSILKDKPLVATSVGARAFPLVLQKLKDLCSEIDPNYFKSLDIIAAENIHDPNLLARVELGGQLPHIHGCSVGKMVPSQQMKGRFEITIRAEAYNTLIIDGTNWKRDKPTDVEWIHFVDSIEVWMNRKLYIHNLGHSACAWISRKIRPDIQTIEKAMTDPDIASHTKEIMYIAAEILHAEYPEDLPLTQLHDHISDLLNRFKNPFLEDGIERVGSDITRKLGQNERLIGLMLLAAKSKTIPDDRKSEILRKLSIVALNAIEFSKSKFSPENDALGIEQKFREEGLASIIQEISGLNTQYEYHKRIIRELDYIQHSKDTNSGKTVLN